MGDEGAATMGDADAAALDQLRQELKRKKFLHTSVMAHLGFISGIQQGQLTSPEVVGRSQDLEAAKDKAKERNLALKSEVAREVEEHGDLYKRRAQVYQDVSRQYEECERMLRELHSLVEEEEAEDTEFASEGPEGLANSLHCSLEEEEVPHSLLEQSDELAKRRRLEFELRCLEKQRRLPEEVRAELAQLEAREEREIDRLEALERLQCEVGLPRLHFDGARGAVVLGGPPGQGERREDLALRTVKVEHDAAGHLVRAETHPSLGLWNEATHCVNDNDLARLLTLVWDRLCEHHSRSHPEPSEMGGA